MKSISFLISKAFLVFCFSAFFSCKGKDDNTAILQEINEGLVQSNQRIKGGIDDILMAFQDRVDDPKMSVKAKPIQPKAIAIYAFSDSLIGYINDLKTALNPNTSSEKKGDTAPLKMRLKLLSCIPNFNTINKQY